MDASISPYLMFPGNASEALAFYASVLGGTPDTTPYTQFGYEDAPEGAVMHGALETPAGLKIFAADDIQSGADAAAFTSTGRISLALFGDDLAQLQVWWDGLSAGGTITMPFEQAPWGDTYGQFTDRFGIEWMINASPAPAE